MPDGSRMTQAGRPAIEIWQDASLAAVLACVDPAGLGGVALRARPGPARDHWMAELRRILGSRPFPLRMPTTIDDERLLGGLDLAATLRAGRPVRQPGLLETAREAGLLIPMAERMGAGLAAKIGAAWDTATPALVIALDEGVEPDETIPAALLDRLAFNPELSQVPVSTLSPFPFEDEELERARLLAPAVIVPDAIAEAIAATATALGIPSMRAPLQAIACARAIAALNGDGEAGELEASAAVRLVLAWRARQMPEAPQEEAREPEPEPQTTDDENTAEDSPDRPEETDPPEHDPDREEEGGERGIPEEILLEAARAALPPDLLARIMGGGRAEMSAGTGAGEETISLRRGRPLASRPGRLGGDSRLDLIATLRTAAPWQPIRRRTSGRSGVIVTAEDFRIRRFRRNRESALIFVVDASGSAALARLGEAKGAVELMLADAYRRREQVALIAFRGTGAELLLPLTKSLVQAKRRLAGLPGGGGTPLAAGLVAAQELAAQSARAGMSPLLAILTDGRGNIARDGSAGRVQAREDAIRAARAIATAGTSAIVIDTSNRPRGDAADLARAMEGRFVALPRAGAKELSAIVRAEG
ncbi:MAG: magnesium chelatase subunit D [Rubricella sp.]